MAKKKKITQKKLWPKEVVHLRSRYVDHSQKFLDWVNGFGFEKTVFGKLVVFLDNKFRLRQLSLLFLYCFSLSFLLFYDFDITPVVRVGRVASVDFKAPISFTMIDEVATEAKKIEAEDSIPPVFDYDPDSYENIFNQVYKAFGEMRKLVEAESWPSDSVRLEEKVKKFLSHKQEFEDYLGRSVSNRMFEWLVEKRFGVRIENIVIRALSQWSTGKIVDLPVNILPDKESKLILRVIQSSRGEESYTLSRQEMKDIRRKQNFSLDEVRGVKDLSRIDQSRVLSLTRSLLIPNVTFNRNETQEKKKKARDAVLPVQISINKNQTIVNQGNIIQPLHVTIFNEIQKRKSQRRMDFLSLISSFLLVCLILVMFSFLRRYMTQKSKLQQRDIGAMAFVSLLVVVFVKVFLFVTEASFIEKFGDMFPATIFLYSAPVALGSMLVGLLINSAQIVWFFTTFMAITLTILVDMNFSFFLLALIGGIAAARGVHNCEKRNVIYIAGIRTGLINAIIISLVLLITKGSEGEISQLMIWNIPAAFVGGILSSLLAMMLIPLMESIFNYTTDVKLLELSNLTHPLMQEMVVKAPGTYHHALVVGSMCEAAARRIGANALLAKVMAYYHDIGKTEHAQYFIENQRPGQNPHDHLSPYMSKTVLVAHVKDGAEMGLHYKLGKPIIDGILQHHGTSLITYFYNKALDEQDEDIDLVKEEDFRYPGPKPQFKEAALVMIADTIEATARSLDDPTPSRLQRIVNETIKNKFIDGQLDECDLTLRDLSIIEEAFEHVILGIYHQRLDYPSSPITSALKLAEEKTNSNTANKASNK